MSHHFVFVSTHRVKEGRLAELAEIGRRFTDFVAADEPGTVSFELYLDGTGAELTHILVQPDAAAMDTHMELSRPLIGAALELVETTAIDVFGTPGPVLGEVLRRNAEAGVPVRLHTPLGDPARTAAA